MFDQGPSAHLGLKARHVSYFCMSSKVGHYRVRAEECCLNAVKAEDNRRRRHWLEAAARWVALGRQEGAIRPRQIQQRLRRSPQVDLSTVPAPRATALKLTSR